MHIMRGHEDFIPELDFVAELDGEIIGNIMYTRAWLTDAAGMRNRCSPSGRCAWRRSISAGLWQGADGALL